MIQAGRANSVSAAVVRNFGLKPGHAASLVFGFGEGKPVSGLKAHVTGPDGSELWCSLLDGETDWHVDSHFSPKGVPLYVTSFGSRAGHKLAPMALVEAIEAATPAPTKVSA